VNNQNNSTSGYV